MTKESIQKLLARTPSASERIKIVFDVKVGNAVKQIELPLVIGIISHCGGDNNETDKNTSFVKITSETFDAYISEINPKLSFTVDKVDGSGGRMKVDLSFKCMDDFGVRSIIRQTPILESLFQDISTLEAVSIACDGYDELIDILSECIKDPKSTDILLQDLEKALSNQQLK